MADAGEDSYRRVDAGGFRLTLLLWVTVLTALLALSLWPAGTDRQADAHEQYTVLWTLAHIPAYALITALSVPLAYMVFRESRRTLILSLVFAIALGILLELVQPEFGRTADASDVALNVLGACLAIGFWTGGRVLPDRGVQVSRREND